MDIYSLVTNTKTAELIFNLSIQIIAISLMGWIIMKLWRPRSATVRSAGYLAMRCISLASPSCFVLRCLALISITWFQPTLELPQRKNESGSNSNQGQ